MARKVPDITQHVALRVRITRMFNKYSLEEAAVRLDMPLWLLSYKENGLANFSAEELHKIAACYGIAWTTFFQDFAPNVTPAETFADASLLSPEPDEQGALIAKYLGDAEAQLLDCDLTQDFSSDSVTAWPESEIVLPAAVVRTA